MVVNIARVAIHIKGEGFLKSLAPPEKRLLNPFINNRGVPTDRISADIKIINNLFPARNKIIDTSLINNIRLLFPSNIDIRFGQPFTRHIRAEIYALI